MVTGILFEILTGGQAASNYPKFLGVLATLYIVEPLVTRIYIQNACAAGEKVTFSGHVLQYMSDTESHVHLDHSHEQE